MSIDNKEKLIKPGTPLEQSDWFKGKVEQLSEHVVKRADTEESPEAQFQQSVKTKHPDTHAQTAARLAGTKAVIVTVVPDSQKPKDYLEKLAELHIPGRRRKYLSKHRVYTGRPLRKPE